MLKNNDKRPARQKGNCGLTPFLQFRHLANFTILATSLILASLLGSSTLKADQLFTDSIGRLNYAGFSDRSHCSTTLISKNAVLTAGHCLKTRHTILLGYSKSAWVESRKSARMTKNQYQDLSIICLSQPSDQQPIQLALNPSTQIDRTVTIFGYGASKPHILSKKQCQIIKFADQLFLNCSLERGMSGGPAIIFENGEPKLVGVASATSDTFSIIEPVSRWVKSQMEKCDSTQNTPPATR